MLVKVLRHYSSHFLKHFERGNESTILVIQQFKKYHPQSIIAKYR